MTAVRRLRLLRAVILATLLPVNGLFEDATDKARATFVSRLWGRFELLPFRRGMALAAVLIVVPSLIIGGLFAIRGGGNGDRPRTQAAAATPSAGRPDDPNTVERAKRTWGEIVTSRSVRSTPKPSAKSSSPGASQSTSPRPPRTHTPGPPFSGTKCPPELKKWPWMWDLCKHRRGGNARP
jgi:hypothetical protein